MNDSIEIYTAEDGTASLEVRLEEETVWLSQPQIAELFETSRENVTMHLSNVYGEGELGRDATSKEFLQVRQEGTRSVRRKVVHYNLDAIISVGYRVKSKVATQFRVWATERLREYLVKGYAINEQRLEQLETVVQILGRSNDELIAGVADVLSGYLPGLTLLRDFDDGTIESLPEAVPGWTLTLDEARRIIQRVASEFPRDHLLGHERGDGLDAVIGAIYQGFGDHELYPTVEEKAANLLYFVVKDHPLSDGNKRSAAALFVTFLANNGVLDDAAGNPRIANNALAAITLMVAMSEPQEKDLMIALIIRMIAT